MRQGKTFIGLEGLHIFMDYSHQGFQQLWTNQLDRRYLRELSLRNPGFLETVSAEVTKFLDNKKKTKKEPCFGLKLCGYHILFAPSLLAVGKGLLNFPP